VDAWDRYDVRVTGIEKKLKNAWDHYDDGDMTTSHFLTVAANTYKVVNDGRNDEAAGLYEDAAE
jgi:hypothetical protein